MREYKEESSSRNNEREGNREKMREEKCRVDRRAV